MHPACSVVVENLRQNKTDQEMVVIKKELIYLQFPGGRVCHGIRAHGKSVFSPKAETKKEE